VVGFSFPVVPKGEARIRVQLSAAHTADHIDRAVSAAREAFDNGPWPRLTHAERAGYLRALGEQVVKRSADIAQMWPRESGVIAAVATAVVASLIHVALKLESRQRRRRGGQHPSGPDSGAGGHSAQQLQGPGVDPVRPPRRPHGLLATGLAG